MSVHTPSYYAATSNDETRHSKLEGDVSTDVCVIGGGFTGISAALHLAEAGFDVILLEGERIGWGASGRNGGQICTAYNPSMDDLEKQVGKEGAKALWDVELMSKDLIRDRVKKHNIDCDLHWGYLHTAAKPSHMKWVNETRDEWARYGYVDTEILDKPQLEERVGTTTYHGALWEKNGGHIHPLNYALGLARAAVNAGVRIYEETRATNIEQGPSTKVTTPHGTVTAKYIIVGGNGYLGDLIPHLYHRVMPVKSFILATAPLGEERAQSLIRDNDAVTDTNNICNYIRLSSDGRMLFGGRANYTGMEPNDLFPYMRPRMLKIFPQLADAELDYCWGGTLAITLDRMPHVGKIGDNLFFAHGYSGHGVALAGIAGKLIADAVQGTAEKFDVMAKIRHQPFPGGPIRMPMLAIGMLYYKLRDMMS
jgi:gamma-glutamylputrescine oxidase